MRGVTITLSEFSDCLCTFINDGGCKIHRAADTGIVEVEYRKRWSKHNKLDLLQRRLILSNLMMSVRFYSRPVRGTCMTLLIH